MYVEIMPASGGAIVYMKRGVDLKGKTQPAEVNCITILWKIIDRLGTQSSGGYISLTPTLKLVKQD